MNKIKEIREKEGMTQDEFAASLKVDRSTVSKWENNLSLPRRAMLEKIAAIFKCQLDDLFTGGAANEKLVREIKVVPRPHFVSVQTESSYLLPKKVKLELRTPLAEMGADILSELLWEIGIKTEKVASGGDVIFEKISCNTAEYYRLKITDKGISVRFCDALGARNAALTLFSIIENENGMYTVPTIKINDWPDNKIRGMLFDPARGCIPVPKLKSYIKQMAKARMNTLVFHCCDTYGLCYESDIERDLTDVKKIGRYTKSEMKDIVNYCRFWGIEIIPEIDYPAHANYIYDKNPDLRCESLDGSVQSNWALCATNEKVFEYLEEVYKEAVEIFGCRYLSICGDELEMLDLDSFDLWTNWESCKHCREVMDKYGYKDQYELYYHAVRRIHGILAKLGVRMLISNDSVNIAENPDIPKDIIIIWWRVAMPKRGLTRMQDMENFCKAGYDVININYEDAYIYFYTNENRLSDWTTTNRPFVSEEYRHKVIGGYFSAWGDAPINHYPWTLPGGIIMYGERLWNNEPSVYDKAYRLALTQAVFGKDVPADLDVFTALGGTLLPLTIAELRRGYPENLKKEDAAYIDVCAERLGKLVKRQSPYAEYAKEFIECLKWTKERLGENN